MTSSPAISGGGKAAIATEDASVLPTVRGVPFWGAVIIAVVLTIIGTLIDVLATTSGDLGWGMRIGFFAGIALAALAVRRGSIFTAMVQAPLVLLGVTVIVLLLTSSQRITFTLIKVVNIFPTMAIGTALGVLLGVVRIFAQPLRRSTAAPRQRAHA